MSRNIKRWIIGLIIIIVILFGIVFYYINNHEYRIDPIRSIPDENAKNIANSFLNNSSLTQYHVNNVTEKYRKTYRVIDSQVNIYDQYNNSIGWVLIDGENEQITTLGINGIEIDGKNHLKIAPKLWHMISESDRSYYCHCILNLEPSFSEEDKGLLIKDQEFEIEFENNTALAGVFPINKINDIINNEKIKNIDYVE